MDSHYSARRHIVLETLTLYSSARAHKLAHGEVKLEGQDER